MPNHVMPNHIKNKVYLSGDQSRIQTLLESVRYDDGAIGSLDCNKIIPMPDSLNLTAGTIEWDAISAYLSAINPRNPEFPYNNKVSEESFDAITAVLCEKSMLRHLYDKLTWDAVVDQVSTRYQSLQMSPGEFVDLGGKYVSNLLKYGATSWYDWCCREWLSKWGAYDADPYVNNTMCFKSANASIAPVITKLAEMYPDIDIEYKWSDEDFGRNVGVMKFSGGKMVLNHTPSDYSEEAYAIVRECWDLTVDEFNEYMRG